MTEPLVVATPPRAELQGISKRFAATQALDDVSLDLVAGEVHALVGENGAGKSTLVKILAGVHQPDSGTIRLDGQATQINGPAQARSLGIAVVHQEPRLFPDLTVAENVFIGHAPSGRLGVLDWGATRRAAKGLFDELGVHIDVGASVRGMSMADQQLIEIAKSLSVEARVLAQWACDLAPNCEGEIAILSATATATNQNAWIADMNTALKDPKFAKLKLVDTVYGDDNATESTKQANALLTKHPNLKVIVAPTTVGILAAAQVVSGAKKQDSVKVTGLGLPNDMKTFVKDGTSPEFGLWNVPALGQLAYAVAAKLISGEIKGTEGETFTVKGLNDDKPYTIGKDSIVILGPPFKFDATNIDTFNF